MLKQLYNLSDENVVMAMKLNVYFQVFAGFNDFQIKRPCCPTMLVKFRQRIGTEGVAAIFAASVKLHGEAAEENTVIVDTTIQEKAITYPTDSKLALNIINRLNKLAKKAGIQQRRTYAKEAKKLRLALRNFRHPRRRHTARKAMRRLRTLAGMLLRELERSLPIEALVFERDRFEIYKQALSQQVKDKNKIYSLHEPGVYCVGKGKDHKQYEYGRKASIVLTEKSLVIIGVASHDKHEHDSKTLKQALDNTMKNRVTEIALAVTDLGYQGVDKLVDCDVLTPKSRLKKDSIFKHEEMWRLRKRRSAIEPVIGHLKHDYRLVRNWLKGSQGDEINLMMAACAWNLKKWMSIFLRLIKVGNIGIILNILSRVRQNPLEFVSMSKSKMISIDT